MLNLFERLRGRARPVVPVHRARPGPGQAGQRPGRRSCTWASSCEVGPAEALYRAPLHPYTVALLDSIPSPDPCAPKAQAHAAISGEPPSPVDPPSGCRFRTRCPRAQARVRGAGAAAGDDGRRAPGRLSLPGDPLALARPVHDIALSFDNGPDPSTTPKVLDVLAAREIPALFCVLGERLARPELRRLTERAHAEGHWIANHTYTHSVPLGRVGRRGPRPPRDRPRPRSCWATSPTPTGCSARSAAAGTSTSGC